jgi:hypothetical protein
MPTTSLKFLHRWYKPTKASNKRIKTPVPFTTLINTGKRKINRLTILSNVKQDRGWLRSTEFIKLFIYGGGGYKKLIN